MKLNFKQKFLFTGLIVSFVLLNVFNSEVKAQAFTIDHVAKTKMVSGSVISTDGKLVAYTVSTPADPLKENAANKSALHVLNMTSGETKSYFSSASVSAIAFRPV